MSWTIAILGLAFLVLIHEAGHFVVARALGMRPRRFYIGFPPAIAKTTRNGIEYGIGAIPLGGYVKIPGMHRPAPSDVDTHLSAAVHEAPQLVTPVERVKRQFARGEFERSGEVEALEASLAAAEVSPHARRRAERGLRDLGDALGRDAYWRAPVWKRIAVIFAGPGTNLVFAVLLLAIVLTVGVRVATLTVAEALSAADGAPARDVDELVELDLQARRLAERVNA